MANNTAGNPLYYDDTTGASWTGDKSVILFQWVDDNQDIADGANLIFTVNGVTMEATVQMDTTATPAGFGPQAVIWQIGPFPKPIIWKDFTLSTLGAGAVHIWVA